MPTTTQTARDYDAVVARLGDVRGSREERMQACADALWDELKDKNCSWVGFYLKNPDADELVLDARRDKPACSPISLFGACGRSFQSRKPLIVTNVANLRAGYIACDPRDRSECVVPLLESFDSASGVLDVDSYEAHAFGRDDVLGLVKVLRQADLMADCWTGEIETV